MTSPSVNFYLFLYLSSFILALSADDWFLIWLALEINMMLFIVLIYEWYNVYRIESCMKYFFVQSLGSALFMGIFYMNKEWLNIYGSFILSYKVGAGPFYFWFPSVSSGLDWFSCMLLFSLQKLIPLMLLVMFVGWVVWFILMLSLMIGVIGSFNQLFMKRLMAYSSIHHIGWLLMCNFSDESIWMIYLFLYSLVILTVIMILQYDNIENLMGICKSKSKWWFLMSILGMGGVPPFLGFFLKWIAFYYFLKMDLWVIIFMIILSVIMIYVYIRIMYNVFMGFGNEMGWFNIFENGNLRGIDFLSILGAIFGLVICVYIIM
uniref:NADH-ubiquinone oxidoreductase chain 2 n=1 Tax=Araneae sp. MT-2014 TaxID=1560008 RepID=A0A0A0RW97_9ARAC|nr:NADH dehydrogenase subunit 2 [Araneae sp. MT-2014]